MHDPKANNDLISCMKCCVRISTTALSVIIIGSLPVASRFFGECTVCSRLSAIVYVNVLMIHDICYSINCKTTNLGYSDKTGSDTRVGNYLRSLIEIN